MATYLRIILCEARGSRRPPPSEKDANYAWIKGVAACALAAVVFAGAATVQQHDKPSLKRVTLASLTAQGFEIKAALREAAILQKGAEVYWCNLRLAETSPLSYQSDCFAVR